MAHHVTKSCGGTYLLTALGHRLEKKEDSYLTQAAGGILGISLEVEAIVYNCPATNRSQCPPI